jgi:hypothetical protein
MKYRTRIYTVIRFSSQVTDKFIIHRGFSTSCIVDLQSYVADFQRHTNWSIHLNYICSYSIRHVINLSVTCDEKRITVYILVLYFIHMTLKILDIWRWNPRATALDIWRWKSTTYDVKNPPYLKLEILDIWS